MTAKTILFFHCPWRLWRARLAGVCLYARKARWRVQVIDCLQSGLTVKQALAFWRPDGCVVEGGGTDHPWVDAAEFGDVPVVFSDANAAAMKGAFFGIQLDSQSIVRVALKELLGLGFSDYAYVGTFRPHPWNEQRRNNFLERVAAARKRGHEFNTSGVARAEIFYMRLRAWLRSLPKPCGILGANDEVADLVLHACRLENILVPEDVAVIGVDNDEIVCESAVPSLSSVVPDFELSGYKCAEMLAERFANPGMKPEMRVLDVSRIVRRGSTIRVPRRDDVAKDALEFIRRNACEASFSVRDVVAHMGCSRRAVEKRFRAFTGHGIGEEIMSMRMKRAQELLLETDRAVSFVSSVCGYANDTSFRRAFKRATGLSPHDWRAQNARKIRSLTVR